MSIIKQKNKIGVIIPCYNHAQFLEESVKSILNQTYENIEIIIVNDGSTDNTQEIAQICVSLDKNRVKLISFTENHGKWFALNKAIEETNSILITCHDADDLSLKDRIERQSKALETTNSIHNLCSFYHCWNQENIENYKNLRETREYNIVDQQTVTDMVSFGWTKPGINHYFTGNIETAGTTAMFYKKIWDIGLRFKPPLLGLRIRNSEDSDFNTSCTLLLNNTTILNEKLYLYRRNTSTNNELK